MHIEQLEYVIEIAKQGNISKAAKKLHVSRSAISQAISNLESELGFPVFIRSRSGTSCTEKGKLVLQLSHEIINKVMELKELGSNTKEIQGNLSISASPIFFSTFLPSAFHTFKVEYPTIQMEIDSIPSETIIEKVKNNQIDIGLILGSEELLKEISTYVHARVIDTTDLMVTVSKHSPLAKMDSIKPMDLLKYPLVIRNEKDNRRTWDNIFSRYGSGNVLFYTNNDDVTKNVIANDLAIGLFTDLMKSDPLVTRGDICLIPYLDPTDQPIYHLICIQTKNKYCTVMEREFIKYTTDALESYRSKIMV